MITVFFATYFTNFDLSNYTCYSVIFFIPQYEDGIIFSQMAYKWLIFVSDKIIFLFILNEDCNF